MRFRRTWNTSYDAAGLHHDFIQGLLYRGYLGKGLMRYRKSWLFYLGGALIISAPAVSNLGTGRGITGCHARSR
jgi:hypothetical protein